MVRRSTLNQISRRIGLDNLIKASITAGTHNSFIGGNAFEALVGAAYLDRGYRKCQQFFLSLITRGYLNPDSMAEKEENFKSLLLEWCQKNRININFETDELNPEVCRKMPSFITRIIIEDHLMGQGRGYSKKESHQLAARRVLERIRERPRVADHLIEDHFMRKVVTDIFSSIHNY